MVKPARQQQKSETRQRLLESARRLFAVEGFEGTTIRQIAKAAGVASGTVLTHYGTKIELLIQVVKDAGHRQVDMARRTLPTDTSAFIRVMHVMRIYYGFDLEQASLVAAVASYSWIWPRELEVHVDEIFAPGDALLMSILDEAIDRGELQDNIDTKMVTKMIFALYMRNLRWAIYADGDVNGAVERLEPQISLILAATGRSS